MSDIDILLGDDEDRALEAARRFVCSANEGNYSSSMLVAHEAAKTRAHGHGPRALEWGLVAAELGDALHGRHPGASFDVSAMHVRVAMFRRFGEPRMVRVLDWARSLVQGLSPAAVKDEGRSALERGDIEALARLRRLKNRLAVLRNLDQAALPDDLREWVEAGRALP